VRETPLKAEHEKLGARMVDFAGWFMPVTYTSIKEEHLRVRTKLGLFDVSHMGRFRVTGADHVAFADRVITNQRAGMKAGRIRYSLVLNKHGGALDDVLVYSEGDEGTFFVVNAGNRDKIWAWFQAESKGFDVKLHDTSEATAMIALQGPNSQALLDPLTDADLRALKYYAHTRGEVLGTPDVMISRTGYTGEDGFELIMPAGEAARFWRELLHRGEVNGVGPAGLGARDTLRLEAGMPLYGHELDESVNPIEAGLDWAVRLEKGEFNGFERTAALSKGGVERKLAGLLVQGQRIPRQGQEVLHEGKAVGTVCSGTKAPWLDEIIATAYLPPKLSETGSKVQFTFGKSGREDKQEAKVVPLPFYKRKK
jgi:aminomethyltransferase